MANTEDRILLKGPKLAGRTNPQISPKASAQDELARSLVNVRKFLPDDFLSRDTTMNEIYVNMVHLFDPYGEMPEMHESDVKRMIADSWGKPDSLGKQAEALRRKYGERSQEVADTLRLISQKASDAVNGYEDAIRAFPAKDFLDLKAAEKAYRDASESYRNAVAINKPILAKQRESEMKAAEEHLRNVRRTLDAFDRIHELANIATYSSALAKEIAPEAEGRSAARRIYLGVTYMERALITGLPVDGSNPAIARAAKLPPHMLPEVKKSAREAMRY